MTRWASVSGADDLDVIVYSACEWCRLALAGNPTVRCDPASRASNMLTTGRMSLPMEPEHRERLRAVRRGQVPVREVLHELDDYERLLSELRLCGAVPDQPDRRWVDACLHRAHTDYWRSL